MFQLLRVLGKCPLTFHPSTQRKYDSSPPTVYYLTQNYITQLLPVWETRVTYKYLESPKITVATILRSFPFAAFFTFGLLQFGVLTFQVIPPSEK